MSGLNLKQLEAFVKVADLGSFRGAATALRTTQPNISARIARLEEQLNQTLMVRDAGSVRLTQSGQVLLAKARYVLDARDEFVAAANAPEIFDGTLRLGVTEMIVHSWLSAYLNALRTKFPNVKVDLTVDLSSNLSNALFAHSIDLALQSEPYGQQTSGQLKLGTYELVWVASPNLGVDEAVSTHRAITQHPILTHSRQTSPYKQIKQHFSSESNVYLVPSTSLAACMRMTREGLGVACLPKAMVTEEINEGRLIQLRYPWVPDNLIFDARFHADKAPYYVEQAAALASDIANG